MFLPLDTLAGSDANTFIADIPNMAEVVGLVAAGGQFIEESIKIIKIAKAARDKYRDAPKEIENWQQQVESLKALVESIPPSLRDAKEIVSTVDRCKAISNSLLHTLDAIQFSESDSFRHKTWRAAVSVLKEGEIRSSFSELEQLKSSLSLHIAVSNL
jgi:predicted RNase H-like nuclease (RuvC/YqgF family)